MLWTRHCISPPGTQPVYLLLALRFMCLRSLTAVSIFRRPLLGILFFFSSVTQCAFVCCTGWLHCAVSHASRHLLIRCLCSWPPCLFACERSYFICGHCLLGWMAFSLAKVLLLIECKRWELPPFPLSRCTVVLVALSAFYFKKVKAHDNGTSIFRRQTPKMLTATACCTLSSISDRKGFGFV